MRETISFYQFSTFIEAHKDVPFRYLIYRRMYTPMEQEQKYTDESFFEDTYYSIGYIRECVQLPDNDYLLGFVDANGANDKLQYTKYVKLSEIRLEKYDGDIPNNNDEDIY